MPSSALKLIQDAKNESLVYKFVIPYASVMIVVSIVCIIIGGIFHGQCSIDSRISIYIIVEGVTVLVTYGIMLGSILFLLLRMKDLGNESSNSKTVIFLLTMGIILSIIYFFTFAWTIAGSVWVFQIKSTVQTVDSTLTNYCQPLLYYYAFAYTIFFYFAFIVYILFFCFQSQNFTC